MKILVVCQYYYPEPFRVKDICEELVRRGHEVTVITGVPNYPMGRVYDGYRRGKRRDEVIDGVKVHRCFTVGRRSGRVWRFLNYYSYMLSSTFYASRIKEEFDVVFVYQLSPVMMARAGIGYARRHRRKIVLYCLDLWPESLMIGGVSRDSAVYRRYRGVSAKIYGRADAVLVTSKSFIEYFDREFGIKGVRYLPQYAEEKFTPEQCRKKPDGYIDIMFAGNVGTAQDVETVLEAVRLTRDIVNLRWHIVGDGAELDHCVEVARQLGLTTVTFHGRKSAEEMPKYYAMADVMLVSMVDDDALSMTLPGKVQSYMAAGKPIIGCIGGETVDVIREAGCGICVHAGDAEALAGAVRQMSGEGEFEQMGVKARAYYDAHFDRKMCMETLEAVLERSRTERCA